MIIFLKLLQMNLSQINKILPNLFIYINYFSSLGYIELQKLRKDLKFENFLSFKEFQDFKVLCVPLLIWIWIKNKIKSIKVILSKILNILIQKNRLTLIW